MADIPKDLYADKNQAYFSNARREIEPFLPKTVSHDTRILEIGCSEGHTLAWLKQSGYCTWAAGVEPYAQLRTDAGLVDQFFKLDIEKEIPSIAPGSIDTILCLDVLEHLIHPWETMRRLDQLLKPGGIWIISVPNLRNYHILADLLFRGTFRYTDSGIMDRSHLRFFTRSSAIELAESTGARVTRVLGTETNRWQKRLLSRLGMGDFMAKQFILLAEKPPLSRVAP